MGSTENFLAGWEMGGGHVFLLVYKVLLRHLGHWCGAGGGGGGIWGLNSPEAVWQIAMLLNILYKGGPCFDLSC